MLKRKVKGKSHSARALFIPSSINEENRSIDVTFVTETPVRMYSWIDGPYDEVLSTKPEHVRMQRIENGAPVLDNHNRYAGVAGVLGVVESPRFKGSEGRATLRFSNREDVNGVWQDVKDGIIRGISVGYRVYQYEEMNPDRKKDEIPQYRAIDWEPFEISIAPVQADPNSAVRSEEGSEEHEIEIITNKANHSNSHIMKREQIIALLSKRGIAFDATATDEQLLEALERAIQPPAAPAAAPVNVDEATRNAIAAERTRVNQINEAVRAAGLDADFGQGLISEGKSIDEARAAIIDEFKKKDPHAGSRGVQITNDERDKERELASAALAIRSAQISASTVKEDLAKEANSRFRGLTLLDIAKNCLERAGVSTKGMDKMEIAGRAITNSSSDFPIILAGANRTVLMAAYNATPDTWRRFCAVGQVSDFRAHKRIRMGSFSSLDSLNENSEYKNKKITDAESESITAGTKGNIINVSRVMIVNDDLGAFTRLAAMLGRAAMMTIEKDVYALLASNPTMADGVALFHANHNNLLTSGGAPSVAEFEAMRVKMAQQMDKDSNEYLDLRPSIWLGPIGLGGDARVVNDAVYDPDTANKLQKPNKVRGLFNDIVDTARLSGTPHYAFADPNAEPVIEVAFLDGVQTPYLESAEEFSMDGIKWKVRLDYGVGAVGYRGAVKNPGA